jgi:hypothetical protein
MRSYWIFVLFGAALLVGGLGWAAFYASDVYPAEEARIVQGCEGPGGVTGCVSPAPAFVQPLFILGEIAAGLGVLLLLAALISFARARTRTPSAAPP